ncbi:MerR family transcriptional regulator [Bradyrhizobium elkanii]|uniref:MerR family transcriptional regulator n=1 Tax=Bradyrhizobium elkanii TaxID=29448 RepID=UPI003510D459
MSRDCSMTERTTSEVAALLGIKAENLRKWKRRGLLKLAPQGVSGQGRSVECMWSAEAVQEARELLSDPQRDRFRRPEHKRT